MFMPFTIHLDPYLRKVIKEERPSFLAMQSGAQATNVTELKAYHAEPRAPPPPGHGVVHVPWSNQPWTTVTLPTPDQNKAMGYPKMPMSAQNIPNFGYGALPTPFMPVAHQLSYKPTLPSRLTDRTLSSLTAEEVGELLRHLDGVKLQQVRKIVKFNSFVNFSCVCFLQADQYARTLVESNISGRVLLYCNLDELKSHCAMSFGDWEIFRMAVLALREREYQLRTVASPYPPQSTTHSAQNPAGNNFLDVDFDTGRLSRSSSFRSTNAATGTK